MPRPKLFDPDTKLREAMHLFWEAGFAGASVPLLEERLGINRFSIYSTFGKKRALFARALDLYIEDLEEHVLSPLEVGTEGVPDLRRFLAAWRQVFVEDEIRGCLLINTAAELGDTDRGVVRRVRAYFDRLESALVGCLTRARKEGAIEGDDDSLARRATGIRLALQGALATFATFPARSEALRAIEAVEELALEPGGR